MFVWFSRESSVFCLLFVFFTTSAGRRFATFCTLATLGAVCASRGLKRDELVASLTRDLHAWQIMLATTKQNTKNKKTHQREHDSDHDREHDREHDDRERPNNPSEREQAKQNRIDDEARTS